ncbi:MAG: sugar transferase, partial [Syntrophaceae bacterium]|nr:sugar transferase [Syntrophaceae bacterium]
MFKQVGVLADTILTIGVFLCVFYIKHLLPEPLGGLASSASYGQVLLMIIIIWYTVSTIVGRGQAAVYTSRITGSVVMGVFKTTTISVFLLIIGMYLLKVTDISRALIAMFYVADLLLLVASRWVSRRLSFAKYRDEYSRRQILVIGSRSSAQELVRMVIASKESSDLQIVGCVDLHREDIGKTVYNGVKVIGTLDDLRDILFNQVVDEILIAMPLNKIENSEWYLSFINAIGITVRIFPDWYIRKFMSTHASRRLRMDRFLSEPALVISRAHVNAESLAIKTILDFLMAAFFLIVTSPLMLGIALLIKLFSPGPVFYSQIRSGQDGRKFSLLKFRSMVVG